ncbi:hypothetical protein AAA088_05905 [Hominifimenecus microfluidus]|uniref:hypothetical protein n=1 Tax=Hominifimenecus microfluidus TaxID=2885348 RepID=UPI0032BFE69B
MAAITAFSTISISSSYNEIKKKTEKLFLFAAESDIIKYIETIQAFLPYLIYWNDMTASLLHNTAGISNTRMISIVTRF